MIPADSIIIDGDTALWVPRGDPDMNPMSGVDHLDRPCDTCGGSGRHTFEIETPGEYGGVSDDGPGPHEMMRFRVHVIDVRPIDFDRWYETDLYRSLPPAAAPGMWLVRLKVHQEVGT